MREGEAGGALCYLVDGGEFAISVGGAQVDSVGEGAVIGELALLYNVPRTATVSCVSDGGASLWVLHRSVFQRTIRAETIARRRQVYEFLKSNHFFSSMGERQLPASPMRSRSSTSRRRTRSFGWRRRAFLRPADLGGGRGAVRSRLGRRARAPTGRGRKRRRSSRDGISVNGVSERIPGGSSAGDIYLTYLCATTLPPRSRRAARTAAASPARSR